MEQSQNQAPAMQLVLVQRGDRWQVYQRLQELGIPCWCSSDGYLQAEINTPTAALQLWSVVRQLSAKRREMTFWLHRCWHCKP
ncbi:Asr1405/Asl0597 family protein [Microseira wollei]|uniref:DUF2007 domain-containing protein n=1 Tax=Microseira wollei NIES-4236 TaxID=2530354 RepID=A0AAV3XAG8_9CYAN|nr:Asr1405/Asl0597 family protein [Microseira wollei]GET37282.1 hypothetical protein MiSe_20350 [Microseira wollei NIES-4236]